MSRLLCSLLTLAICCGQCWAESKPHDFGRWDKEIQAFESQDREHPPQAGGVLFVGSSTIRLWNTQETLPGLNVVNRGFGGSEMIDSAHFAERIIIPHRPKVILVYAGSNDIAKGVRECEILANFDQLVATVHAQLPETEIVFMSVKPTRKRWPLIHHVRATNALIEARCLDTAHLHFLNVYPYMLNAEGEPEVKWLAKDGLHLNPTGYVHLSEVVRPVIEGLLSGSLKEEIPAAVPAAAGQ
ncbi:MAG: GDSL-type esterase/lipase family protein [Planctomycetaceae bacterium]